MKISMNICRRVVGLVVLAVFVVSAATSDEFARWTNTVRRVEIRSSKDGTLQPSWFWAPPEAAERPVPLFVATHTWSYDLNVLVHYWGPLDWCRENGWALLCPNFRGPNKTPQACGSDLAVQDVVDAVAWAKREVKIDADRIYMMGGSGGGHITLLLAGRHPEIWAGVVAWCANVDLALWHEQLTTKVTQFARYAKMLEQVCGGTPAERMAEYRRRSPCAWLAHARERGVPVYIATGIHDGHPPRGGSVPVSQSLLAFNLLCRAEDRLSDAEIAYIDANEAVPDALAYAGPGDPFYADRNKIVFRRISGNVQQTLFEGGHDCNYPAGFEWLARQRRGRPADFSSPKSGRRVVEQLTY